MLVCSIYYGPNSSTSSLLAFGDFCHLLLTLANCLNPDQDRQNVGPDQNPNSLTCDLIVFLNDFFFKNGFEKSQQMTKNTITQHANSIGVC